MKFAKVMLLILSPLILIVVWVIYRQFFAIIDDFSYRLTANFEENGRPVAGSGVIRVILRPSIVCIASLPCAQYARRGEAIPVRFSNNKTVLIMLAVAESTSVYGTTGTWPAATFKHLKRPSQIVSERPPEPLPVPPEYMPTIVYFRDLNDPTTVQVVDPQNMADTVGAGIRLTSMTIQLTDDPVNWGLEKLLPWVLTTIRADPKQKQYRRNFPMLQHSFPQYMHVNQL